MEYVGGGPSPLLFVIGLRRNPRQAIPTHRSVGLKPNARNQEHACQGEGGERCRDTDELEHTAWKCDKVS